MATLFQECIDALGCNAEIMSEEETKKLFGKFETKFSFTINGRINWDLVEKKIKIEDIEDIPKLFLDSEDAIFVLWDDAECPALKSTLKNILYVLEDVTAVSFDTWLFSPQLGYVIEFYRKGDITLGFFSESSVFHN